MLLDDAIKQSGSRPDTRLQPTTAGAILSRLDMRKQYFFRPTLGAFSAWDVDRLVALTRALPRRRVALSDIRELDEPWFGSNESPTWRALVEQLADGCSGPLVSDHPGG